MQVECTAFGAPKKAPRSPLTGETTATHSLGTQRPSLYNTPPSRNLSDFFSHLSFLHDYSSVPFLSPVQGAQINSLVLGPPNDTPTTLLYSLHSSGILASFLLRENPTSPRFHCRISSLDPRLLHSQNILRCLLNYYLPRRLLSHPERLLSMWY